MSASFIPPIDPSTSISHCSLKKSRIARAQILSREDLDAFHTSQAFNDYVSFIQRLNDEVIGLPTDSEVYISTNTTEILNVLDQLSSFCQDFPPEKNQLSRYGNPAYRKWYRRMLENIEGLLQSWIPGAFTEELAKYLSESFGNWKRIDYGTGHEAHFVAFLCCCDKIGIFSQKDYPALVLRVFVRYIELMRQLQCTYWLEPAGSHGVWGLDDYHFLPFLFGSAQLIGHNYIRPKSIHDPFVLEDFGDKYIYLACIRFVNEVKTESLRWHSPMLDDISGVKTWEKVNQGMIKMYKVEVLGKLPIMQHFLFGSLLSFKGSASEQVNESDEEDCGHRHVYAKGQEPPPCCGIRVPAVFGASSNSTPLRKVPFD